MCLLCRQWEHVGTYLESRGQQNAWKSIAEEQRGVGWECWLVKIPFTMEPQAWWETERDCFGGITSKWGLPAWRITITLILELINGLFNLSPTKADWRRSSFPSSGASWLSGTFFFFFDVVFSFAIGFWKCFLECFQSNFSGKNWLPRVIVSCCYESDKVWIMKTVPLGIWRARRIA